VFLESELRLLGLELSHSFSFLGTRQ
jgi:hypothetical protein